MALDLHTLLSWLAQEAFLNKDKVRGLIIFRLLTEAAQGHEGASFTLRADQVTLEGVVFNQEESISVPLREFTSAAESLGMKAVLSKTTPRNGCVLINWDKPVCSLPEKKFEPICIGAKPVHPNGLVEIIQESVHPDAIDIFNGLIAKNFKGNYSRIEIPTQEFMDKLKERFKDESVYSSYEKHMVTIFRKSGWNIYIDEPGFCETYSSLYVLSYLGMINS